MSFPERRVAVQASVRRRNPRLSPSDLGLIQPGSFALVAQEALVFRPIVHSVRLRQRDTSYIGLITAGNLASEIMKSAGITACEKREDRNNGP